jgi:nucleoside-diphosphate-sugar epimerase
MTRTLVTGAAGFTGRYLGEVLSQRGHELHGLVHEHGGAPLAHYAHLHEGDLTDAEAVRSMVKQVEPEHVVHLAAIAFVAHADVEQMYRANILGTRHLLEALSGLARKPKSVLLASSANVYGNAREGILDETIPPAPANDYGVTKAAMEYVAAIYAAALPITVVRPFNYTGRGQGTQFIIPKIVDHVRRRAQVIELGNLDVARDFSDVRTVVDAYARLLEEPRAIGETFNVCSGRAVSLQQILDLATDISGHRIEARVKREFVRENEVRTLQGSAAKIESVTGPLQRISLEETLQWMLDE